MKGVSAVIAIIMLLMITVALVGMAYIWFTTIFTTITTETGEAATTGIKAMGTQFSIESAVYDPSDPDKVKVGIRNTGSQKIDLTTLSSYINELAAEITSGNSGELEPGKTKQNIIISNSTIFTGAVCDKTLKLTAAPQAQASRTIKCI